NGIVAGMFLKRDLVTRVTLAAVGIAGVWAALAQQQQQPLTMEKVSENLWVIMGDGGNVAVMPTSEGVVLVDDKFARDAPEIQTKVKTVSEKPIRYVLNTHQHGDHTGGNAALLDSGAEIIVNRNARANMATQKMPGAPRLTFSDEQEVY